MSLTLKNTLSAIRPADRAAMERAKRKWDSVGKPLGSLGLLEEDVIRIAGMFRTEDFSIDRKCVVIMCADNGVVEAGVTQSGQEVTAIVAENMAARHSSVCRMAQVAGAEVYPVDIGVYRPIHHPGIAQRCVRRGTRNLAVEPPMTREETIQAIEVGISTVQELYDRGVRLFATGEMGIGNTTTSAAVLSVLLHREPAQMTGRGSGLSDEGLSRKVSVITHAIETYHPDPTDGVDVLSKVGGLDIAGLCGVFLGCALCRVPVLIDGLISAAAALVAATICPTAKEFMLASHQSAEPAGEPVLKALGVTPILHAEMRLGEGTGAVAIMPILDMAMTIYNGDTFEEIHVEAYTPQS
jgi:nicotinate-nucleotide--dimethylbenzimidazole phosphoribosyltransferase